MHMNEGGPAQLETIDEDTGKMPEERLKNADVAYNIYLQMEDDDRARSRDRACIQAMLDGAPPIDPARMRKLGRSGLNVNFLEGDSARAHALAPYHDLVHSVDKILDIRTAEGDPSQQAEWSEIISEEFHLLITEWPAFDSRFQNLCDGLVVNGVVAAFFLDGQDWRFDTERIGKFKLPNRTKADEDEIEICTLERTMSPSLLYRKIRNESSAKTVGWNIESCRKAIVNYTRDETKDDKAVNSWNYEAFQEAAKNNDLAYGYSGVVRDIPLIHYLVKEFDGKISHYIGVANSGYEDFLYRKRAKFDSIRDALVVFTNGIGNGTYHSIRGYGYKLYPQVQILNRLRCAALEGTMNASTVWMRPRDSTKGIDIQMTRTVPGAGTQIIHPDLEIIESQLPNVGQIALPMISEMSRVLANNVGEYSASAQAPSQVEKSKYQVQVEVQRESVLESAAQNLFYGPWKRLLRQVYQRAVKAPDDESRGFVDACLERGVPVEALTNTYCVKPVRAVGNGSPQLRMSTQERILGTVGSMDEVGKVNALRDYLQALPGVDSYNVQRYVAPDKPRETDHEQFARLENAAMRSGMKFPVLSIQNSVVHAGVHLNEFIKPTMEAIAGGQVDPLQVIGAVREAIAHTAEHGQAVMQDPNRVQEGKAILEETQQLENMANQIEQQASMQAMKQEEEAARAQGQVVSAEHQEELEFLKQKNQLEIQALQQKAEIQQAMNLSKMAGSQPE